MTDAEIEKLATAISKHVAAHPVHCLSFEPETIEDVNAFFKRLRSCKAVAWSTFITAIVVAVIGAFVAGVGVKVLELLKNTPK
jgi:hypothetical protein